MGKYQVIYDYEDDFGTSTFSDTFNNYEDAMEHVDYLNSCWEYSNIELIDLNEVYMGN